MHGKQKAAYSDPGNGVFTIVFDPKDHFGVCSTNNGDELSAIFSDPIDINKALDLVVNRDDGGEQYVFHYFMVELL